MNVWHPLWLPKMVLDDFEQHHKGSSPILSGIPEHELWGNDGLVTLQSARWGQFLGIMEQCDHWDLRGAGGPESALELAATSLSDPETARQPAEAWAFGDWAKFVKAWKREEKKSKDAMPQSELATPDQFPSNNDTRESTFLADDVVKASTDKLSAVFDWIVDQVPSRSPSTSQLPSTKSDLSTKEDLERFYVALCRKLYEEGL